MKSDSVDSQTRLGSDSSKSEILPDEIAMHTVDALTMQVRDRDCDFEASLTQIIFLAGCPPLDCRSTAADAP
jgi:hypothetical protein